MPLSLASRYRGVPTLMAPNRAGRPQATVGIRPQPASAATGLAHLVVAGETLEALAFRYLGASDAWWRIADANPSALPFAPVPGTQLIIPTDGPPGLIERTRPF